MMRTANNLSMKLLKLARNDFLVSPGIKHNLNAEDCFVLAVPADFNDRSSKYRIISKSQLLLKNSNTP